MTLRHGREYRQIVVVEFWGLCRKYFTAGFSGQIRIPLCFMHTRVAKIVLLLSSMLYILINIIIISITTS